MTVPEAEAPRIEAIIAEYEAGLLRYAARLLNNADAAQDVVQEAFIKLCRKWRDGTRPPDRIKSWLFRVTHNAAVDHIRRESRLRLLHDAEAERAADSEPPSQREQLERQEAEELVLAHLRRLKVSEQQVVILRLQEGLSYREIAAVTGRSEGNVGCVLHHAVKKLASSLKQAGALEP